ncbi:MAG: SPOR domain-containing protein [Gemmatimonadota bacterium]
MQRSAWSDAIPWDPAHAPVPSELDRVLATRLGAGAAEGSVPVSAVLVVASETAWHDGWSVRTTIALADHLAKTYNCLLLDLAVEGGELHPSVDVENVEGVADIFLYGASLKHVIVKPPKRRFKFAPAGIGGEPMVVLTDTRWVRLLSEQKSAGVLVLAYVPSHSDGLEILSDRIPNILALARTEELNVLADRLSADAVCLAVIAPDDPIIEEAAAPVPETRAQPVVEEDDEEGKAPERNRERDFEAIRVPRNAAREALIADLRSRQRAALMAPPPAPAPPVEELAPAIEPAEPRAPAKPRGPSRPQPSLSEPSFATTEPRPTVKSRKRLYIGLSLVVLAVLIVGAWLVVRRYVELSATPAVVPPTTSTGAPVPAAPTVPSSVVPLPYAVAVEAHQELPLAVERVNALSSEEKDIGFYIAPILVDSVLYYRIMAGPVTDSTAALAIMQRLLDKGHKTGASASDLRHSPLAFSLGDYESESGARARASEAGDLGIPAYVIEVATPAGERRYRVYAGAYAGLAEADVMRRLLRSAGLPDSLVPRVGVRK